MFFRCAMDPEETALHRPAEIAWWIRDEMKGATMSFMCDVLQPVFSPFGSILSS